MRPLRFVSYEALQRSGDQPQINHYELVYVAPLLPYWDQNTLLDEIYEKFNIAHSADFHGHSLSVSDIVAIRSNG
ncbi:YodL domain-containing protein [Pyramidobacter porci]